MCITSIQLIAITDVMTTSSISSAVPTTTGTTILVMVDSDVTATVKGVAGTLVVIEITLDVVKCVGISKRCVPINGTLLIMTCGVTADSEPVTSAVSLYTPVDCDDGVSGEYVIDMLEQCMGITVSLGPQHIGSPLVQLVQSLLISNVIMMVLMSDEFRVSGSFN